MLLSEAINTDYFLIDVWPKFERHVFAYLHKEVVTSPSRKEIMKRSASIFQHLSEYLSKLVATHIRQKYGGVFMAGNKMYRAEDIRFRLLIKHQEHINGEYTRFDTIRVRIPYTLFSQLINNMALYLFDEDIPVRLHVKHFCHELFEIINHELIHAEQELRFSSMNTPAVTHKSLIKHEADPSPDEGTKNPESYMRYLGLTNEIEAFAGSCATKWVKEATRGIERTDKEAWNKAIDSVVTRLKKSSQPNFRSSIFLSSFYIIKQALKEKNANIKDYEIENVWKRFISKTYIQMQQLKV